MLIDVHCHIVPPEMARDPAGFGSRDPHFGQLVWTKGAKFSDGEELVRDLQTYGVSRAVVFGFAFKDVGVSRLQNDYALALAKEHPGKILAFAVLDPESPGAMEEAERSLSSGACGFGELFPAGHGFSLLGKGMDRLAGLARESQVPLLIHVNEQVGHSYPGKGETGAVEAYRFAAAHPEVSVIFAHLGGGLPFFETMPEVSGLERVFYDTAAQPFLYRKEVYAELKAAGAIDKVLLGTDFPLLSPKRYLRDLKESGLPEDDVDRVASGNALRLLARFFSASDEGN